MNQITAFFKKELENCFQYNGMWSNYYNYNRIKYFGIILVSSVFQNY